MSQNVSKGKRSMNERRVPDMKFVKNFTPPDFQAKKSTPLISPNSTVWVIQTPTNE